MIKGYEDRAIINSLLLITAKAAAPLRKGCTTPYFIYGVDLPGVNDSKE